MFTSLEQFPSKTSSIASIPWEETSCGSISGASVRMINWVKVIISGNRRERNIDGYQLITGFLQLKVGCSRREFVDQLVNRVAEAGMLVSLKVGLQVIFGKSFVNLEGFSIMGRQRGQLASPLQMDLPHRSVRLQAEEIMSALKDTHELETIPTHDLPESRVVSWSGGAAVVV